MWTDQPVCSLKTIIGAKDFKADIFAYLPLPLHIVRKKGFFIYADPENQGYGHSHFPNRIFYRTGNQLSERYGTVSYLAAEDLGRSAVPARFLLRLYAGKPGTVIGRVQNFPHKCGKRCGILPDSRIFCG